MHYELPPILCSDIRISRGGVVCVRGETTFIKDETLQLTFSGAFLPYLGQILLEVCSRPPNKYSFQVYEINTVDL